jgi:hypothetical protein
MKSWKKLKGYEFVHWNLERFPLSKSIWVKEAFEAKKYAFAADYIRLYALYHYGGIYLDSDVEVLKSFDQFLELREMVGREQKKSDLIEMAALGVEPHAPWIKLCLDYYEGRHFIKENGEYDMLAIPFVVERILQEHGYILRDVKNWEEAKTVKGEKEIAFFPKDFFSPMSNFDGFVQTSPNTCCIHHFTNSWTDEDKTKRSIRFFGYKVFGKENVDRILELYGRTFLYRKIKQWTS